ncbi:hypothetical protein PGTUg99_028207 [Puccinia graminis f. sp. tritici]|uniref:Uncharacterized protein n=1 Tax=Puccinia graminis f. sp. tritici TaxID=56615 RepID=A0A5B0QLH5_PUCGR|nr:hypothetical protein PGTUg99_028207 [Puccinia graminis f. sp. tritici]
MRESLSASHVSPRQVFMAGQNWGDNLGGRTVWQLFQDSSVPNSIGLSPTDLRNSTVPGCLLPPEVTISNPSSLPHLGIRNPTGGRGAPHHRPIAGKTLPHAAELLSRSQLAYNRVHPAAFRKTKIEKTRKLQFFSSDLKD